LFLGFDYRYTGNSKYLFEEMIKNKKYKDRDIRFITNDEMVDDKYRISPHGDEYSKWTARAEVVIAESWIPGAIKKREESVIIQLWHGTPLKKVLFDSSEASLMEKNEKYKIGRHWNIMRWDYLLADSAAAARKLQSSFLIPRKRILTAGYPRVKYLIDNVDNTTLKRKIKKSIGIGAKLQDKKVVLYAPTWRDYNYGKPLDKQDFSYVVDLNALAENLGDDYLILYHDHHFLSQMPGALHKNCIDVGSYETQDLLLIADCLVTDYSSILFDAFPIKTPVVLYVNDFNRYEKVRGVHRGIWNDLLPFVAEDSESLAEKIKEYKITKAYSTFNEKYCYQSDVSLVDFIEKLDVDKLERTW
jgi:CDP-glycerol glycerophosphotransferase